MRKIVPTKKMLRDAERVAKRHGLTVNQVLAAWKDAVSGRPVSKICSFS